MSIKDTHRLFLQTLMSRQFMQEKEVKALYRQSCEAYEEDCRNDQFQGFINTVNKNLKPLFMELKQGVSEEDGVKYYGLVNTTEDEHSKLATDYTPNDIAFFKKAIDLIVSADDGTISSLDLINVAADLEKKMAYSYTEKLLKKLVVDKWLEEFSGIYCLGGRAMLELEQYLKKTYEDDISECMMCKRIAIKSQQCQNCQEKLHKHCAGKYFAKRANRTCPNPNCVAPWTHSVPTVTTRQDDDIQNDSSDQATHRAGPSGRSRSKRSR